MTMAKYNPYGDRAAQSLQQAYDARVKQLLTPVEFALWTTYMCWTTEGPRTRTVQAPQAECAAIKRTLDHDLQILTIHTQLLDAAGLGRW